MKLLDRLEALFVNQPPRKKEEHPSLFDRLRNVFFAAESLKQDLQRIPPLCRCGDALAHLEGRCSCTKTSATPEEAIRGKGCLSHLEMLHLDLKSLRESLQRHRGDLQPEEQTEELLGELSLIENFEVRLSETVENIRNHAAEFQASCSNEALQRLKASSSEIDRYSTEFFWSLLRHGREKNKESSSQRARA